MKAKDLINSSLLEILDIKEKQIKIDELELIKAYIAENRRMAKRLYSEIMRGQI